MAMHRIHTDEPRQRWIGDIVDDVMAKLARPADTPAVSPWTSAPESFAEMDREGRADARAMAPVYARTGVAPTGRTDDMADWRAQAVASLPRDPEARIGVFARARFPELAPEDAARRYGAIDDRIFYIDRDGTPKWEEATIWDALDDPYRATAAHAGPAMAFGGAAAGGFVGGVPGAAAGAGLADIGRQYLAYRLAGERLSPQERAMHTAMEAAAGGIGRYAGNRLAARMGPTFGPYLGGAGAQFGARRIINRGAFNLSRALQDQRDPPEDENSLWTGAP
jgi:hypothetical protein